MNTNRPQRSITAVAMAAGLLLANCGPAAPGEEAEATETSEPTDVTWSAAAPLPDERTEVSVTTDGETVYLIGGFGPPEGEGDPTAPRAMWAFDAAADSWEERAALPEGINHAGFVAVDRRLYVIGGFRENSFDPVSNVWIYDPDEDSWAEGAPLPTPRGAMAVTVLDGRIHAMGGNVPEDHDEHDHGDHGVITEDNSVGTHEVYDPGSNRWSTAAPMPTPRNHHAAAALNGRIYVPVGRADGDFEMTVNEIYDATDDTWTEGAAVPTGRSGVAVVEHDGWIYLFGGETFGDDGRTFDDAERYDPEDDRWETLPAMPTARHGLGAAVVNGAIYVISGGPEPGLTYSTTNERLEVE